MERSGESFLNKSAFTVISVSLIKEIISKSKPFTATKKCLREQFSQAKHLRLEFLDIICIDSLWMLTNLTELYLNNNRIGKITNIEALVNLTQLDLSYNRITTIENLETLTKLTKLSFSHNQISKLKNIDNCILLKVLVCNNNLLSDRDDVLYLQKFPKLKTLSLSGNPFSSSDGFDEFVAKNLPQLVYFDFKMLQSDDGKETRLLQLRKTVGQESDRSNMIKYEGKMYANEFDLHKDAFVECLNGHQLFDAFFPTDHAKQIYSSLSETEGYFIRFKMDVHICTQGAFQLGLKQLGSRNKELSEFGEAMEKLEQDFASDSCGLIDTFSEEKNQCLSDLKKCMSRMSKNKNDKILTEIKNLQESFEEKLENLWFELMQLEDIRNIQIKELLKILQKNLKLVIKEFTFDIKGFFCQIREHVNTFVAAVKEFVEGQPQLCSNVKQVWENLEAGKETMYDVVDEKEDQLIISVWNWFDELFEQYEREEFARNRNMMAQINNFTDFQLNEVTVELSSTTPEDQTEFSYSDLQLIKDLSQIQ